MKTKLRSCWIRFFDEASHSIRVAHYHNYLSPENVRAAKDELNRSWMAVLDARPDEAE